MGMDTSKVTSKGQLLIPKHIRSKYGFNPGIKVIFEETDGGVIIKAMDQNYFRQFRGKFKSSIPIKEEWLQYKKERELEERKIERINKEKK